MPADARTANDSRFTGLVLVTIPILLVSVLFQRHIIKGIAAGALQG